MAWITTVFPKVGSILIVPSASTKHVGFRKQSKLRKGDFFITKTAPFEQSCHRFHVALTIFCAIGATGADHGRCMLRWDAVGIPGCHERWCLTTTKMDHDPQVWGLKPDMMLFCEVISTGFLGKSLLHVTRGTIHMPGENEENIRHWRNDSKRSNRYLTHLKKKQQEITMCLD